MSPHLVFSTLGVDQILYQDVFSQPVKTSKGSIGVSGHNDPLPNVCQLGITKKLNVLKLPHSI